LATSVHQFLCLTDNYGVLVHDSATGATASIDASEAGPILAALGENGWNLTHLLITHHHADHVQGTPELKARFPAVKIIGPAKEAEQIGVLDVRVGEGDVVQVGSVEARTIDTPGHTRGQVNYHFAGERLVFTGDTLFSLGCGRCFETPYEVLWSSLAKLAALPRETKVYCGHEYTEANARFALTIEPDNEALKARAAEVARLRTDKSPTLPTTIGAELAANPFLRADQPSVQAALGMPGADPAAVFAEIRSRKDRF
jgi:hydroxyacylglutathione hydrolase